MRTPKCDGRLAACTRETTKLQPAFTGHGMFSGTGFLTKEGLPAAIYHGQNSGANQIAIAKDRQLSGWEKPYPVVVENEPDGMRSATIEYQIRCSPFSGCGRWQLRADAHARC